MGAIAEAIAALTQLGWKSAIARQAVDLATRELGPETPLEPLIRRALRRCN